MRKKYRNLLDGIGRIPLRTEPAPKPQPAPQPGPGRPIANDARIIVHDLGHGRYRVAYAGRIVLLDQAKIEVRPGGRRHRNMIRWLVGRVAGVLHAVFLGFVELTGKARREEDVALGLHRWLDSFIRRAGATFAAELFKIVEMRLARV